MLASDEQVVVLALELAGDLGEVVADVAQVLARAAAEPGEVADRLRGGPEVVALVGEQPVVLADLLAQPVDLRELLAAGAVEHLGLERVDPRPRSPR